MSAPAEDQPRFWSARTILALALLAEVPVTVFDWLKCPGVGDGAFCQRFGNTVVGWFWLLPMNLMMAFPHETPLTAVIAVPAALTLLSAWLVFRFAPRRLALWRVALIVGAWYALSWLVFYGELFLPH